MSTTPETPSPAAETKEDTTVALLSYLTPILFGVGIVIAIVMHSNKKTKLGAFHLRQSLGLLLTCIALWIPGMILSFLLAFVPFLIFIITPIWFCVGLAVFVLWVMGLLAAINGQQKPLPVVGEYYQKWFANAFV
jgi:uncharacterized membrane protein